MKHVTGWWFAVKRSLPHGDGRRVVVGRTHSVDGKIVPRHRGLHLSVKAIDALSYATGSIVYRVRGHGVIVPGDDKVCCSRRTYLAGGIDVSDVLRRFARLCALDVIDKWDAPNVVIKYLRTGDESLRSAARSAADSAARSAAYSAAYSAADLAAYSAARSAAYSAADSAADSAAYSAADSAADSAAASVADSVAYSAAYSAARDTQNKRLHRMLMQAIRDAR